MTVRRTSALLRSRTPRTYSSLRSSSAAMVAALIMPRSATTQIRPVVFRVAAPAELLAALSLEGQAGGIHEDDAELGKQVAPAGEQLFLHKILAAARRQLAGPGLIRQWLAEPRHGAVEVL